MRGANKATETENLTFTFTPAGMWSLQFNKPLSERLTEATLRSQMIWEQDDELLTKQHE